MALFNEPKIAIFAIWKKYEGCEIHRARERSLLAGLQTWKVWQYGVWSFQTGDTKLERFLPKNQHIQRKLLNFEFWINGELSKSAKI